MKKSILALSCLCCSIVAMAQPAQGYYTASTLDGKNTRALELALFDILHGSHTRIAYDNLWEAFKTTDVLPAELLANPEPTDQVYDIYASWTDFPKYHTVHEGTLNGSSTLLHSQTGGFNREHGVANSWWGGDKNDAYSDLHHLTPADGAANNAKQNYPIGEYAEGMDLTWPKNTSTNSLGLTYVMADNTPDHSGSWTHVYSVPNPEDFGGADHIFEPADEFKGDFARMYLYVICAYEKQLKWSVNYMFTNDADGYTVVKPWAMDLLLKWHRQDPISDRERNRNNAVQSLQGDRNPFIDYPELVEFIWGNRQDEQFSLANAVSSYSEEYINPEPIEIPTFTYPDDDLQILFPFYVKLGENFVAPVATSNSYAQMFYVSSNPDVAAVNPTTGAVTLKAAGTTIITAYQPRNASHAAGYASYLLVVRP